MITIKWHYGGEHGAWVSGEGRFTIGGGGYRHGLTPDFYTLRDSYDQVLKGFPDEPGNFDTVREAKDAALARVVFTLASEGIG